MAKATLPADLHSAPQGRQVYWLEHPDRLRAVTFRPLGNNTVVLRKKQGQTWVYEEVMPVEFARKRYQWYLGLGYRPW